MGKRPDRRAKLAEALRENLRRRKEQERQRSTREGEVAVARRAEPQSGESEGKKP
jgi:hypothetical protein